ncbi:hypothetical protein ACJX0J_033689, partial [Zea mays]
MEKNYLLSLRVPIHFVLYDCHLPFLNLLFLELSLNTRMIEWWGTLWLPLYQFLIGTTNYNLEPILLHNMFMSAKRTAVLAEEPNIISVTYGMNLGHGHFIYQKSVTSSLIFAFYIKNIFGATLSSDENLPVAFEGHIFTYITNSVL